MGESSFTPPPLIINDGIVKSMDMKLRFPDASKALHPSSLRRTSKYALYNTSQYCGLYEQLLIVKSSLSRLLWLWQTDYVLEELIP